MSDLGGDANCTETTSLHREQNSEDAATLVVGVPTVVMALLSSVW